MPELPEVEFTARQLRASIVGATIRDAAVFWERIIGHPDPDTFRAEIAGQRIESVRRRGKYLLLDLSGAQLLTVHRRMTGNFLLLPAGWEIDCSLRQSDPVAWKTRGPSFTTSENHSYSHEHSYCRLCFNLSDGRRLLFTDPRKFGRVELWPSEQEQKALASLGPEPLGELFSADVLAKALEGRRSPIKQALLDQSVVAGVGNIYADEALFYARIHPLRPSNTLNASEIAALREGIVSVLTLGIEHGGTSFSNYRDLWGETGDNYNHVRIYKHTGLPCERCGTPIERIVVAQRSTHVCPNCQKLTME